jgi:phospholipid N-methyltransferase
MARRLRQRFPSAHIITGDAWHLDDLLRECYEPIESVGAVISSLPLLNFPPDEADALAEKIRAILEHGGKWVQYSYHLGNGHHKSATHFRRLASKIVWLNLPPARVNVYQK